MAEVHATLAARLGYAQCWEDTRLLRDALRVGPGDRVLSIASAGDNSVALALEGAEVDAIDLSAAQLALVELKLAGRELDYAAYRELLGLDPGDPIARYRRVRGLLSPGAQAWWDGNQASLVAGVLDSGRFERYLALFRERLLPLVHRAATVEGWFDLPDMPAQRRYYRDVWDRRRWRALFRLFFSRRVMAWRGRSPEQFAHVEGEVSELFLQRARRVLTELPLGDNGYVQWMLLGRYVRAEALPTYLTAEGHARLGEAAARIRLIHAALEDHLAGEVGPYNAYNLSDVFEYLSPLQTEALYRQVVARAAPGARVAYWNLLVPRERPINLAERVVAERALGDALRARDRAFVYGAFRVEVVR